jgi:DNA-directed RNA polymerase subunit RPC12/RpoP
MPRQTPKCPKCRQKYWSEASDEQRASAAPWRRDRPPDADQTEQLLVCRACGQHRLVLTKPTYEIEMLYAPR